MSTAYYQLGLPLGDLVFLVVPLELPVEVRL